MSDILFSLFIGVQLLKGGSKFFSSKIDPILEGLLLSRRANRKSQVASLL